jgi:hypothetical protein
LEILQFAKIVFVTPVFQLLKLVDYHFKPVSLIIRGLILEALETLWNSTRKPFSDVRSGSLKNWIVEIENSKK